MKVLLGCLALLLWSAQCFGQQSCLNQASVFVDCDIGCMGKPNSTPNALTLSLAQAAATTYQVCSNQTDIIWVQGKQQTPNGFLEDDWYFNVDASGNVVFDVLSVERDQVPRAPSPGSCSPGSQCLGGTGWVGGSDGSDYGTWYYGDHINCNGPGLPPC